MTLKINQTPLPQLSVCIRCSKVTANIAGTIIGTFHDWETHKSIDNFYADICHDCLKEINELIENGAPVAIAAKSKKQISLRGTTRPHPEATEVDKNRVGYMEWRMTKKSRFVQLYNPATKRWVKIDREAGRIIDHKDTPGPYDGVTKYRAG